MPIVDPGFHMWFMFALISGAIVLYTIEKIPLELTSVAVVSILLLTFQLAPLTGSDGTALIDTKTLLSGFADPALIAIIALLVIGQAMVQTGALDDAAQTLVQHGTKHPGRVIVLSFLCVMVLSAFLNNTPVVVIFIPIMSVLADKLGRSASALMIPLSFVAILGGMTTLIGSSTNLLVAGTLKSLTSMELGFFDFTIPGLVLAGVGLLFVLVVAPRILPDRTSVVGSFMGEGKQFIVQIDIGAESPLINSKFISGMFPDLPGMTVRLLQRREHAFLPPFEDMALREGDEIVVATTRKALTEVLATHPGLLDSTVEEKDHDSEEDEISQATRDRTIAEVVVAPASRMDGRTLEQIGFHAQSGCIVLGIQRRSRMIRAAMDEIRLEAGDVLLLMGRRENILKLRSNRDVLLLEWSAAELPARSHARRSIWIFTGVVLLASTNMVPITIASLLGVTLMITLGCLNIRQAARAVDRRVILLVGAALAMGNALEITGGAAWLAHALAVNLESAGPVVMLSGFFLLIATLTNVLSNNATAVLFTPIAINLANELDIDPKIFVITVILAANCSFATPISYQTNLLVMAPGHYKFTDFMRVGIPLIILLWITFTLFFPWYYNI